MKGFLIIGLVNITKFYERFFDYWFSKYYKVLRWPMIMYNLDKNKLTSIGKI